MRQKSISEERPVGRRTEFFFQVTLTHRFSGVRLPVTKRFPTVFNGLMLTPLVLSGPKARNFIARAGGPGIVSDTAKALQGRHTMTLGFIHDSVRPLFCFSAVAVVK